MRRRTRQGCVDNNSEFASGMEGLEATGRNYVCMIAVEGMTCNSCVDLIYSAMSQLRGVNAVNVSKQNTTIASYFVLAIVAPM